MGQSFQIAANYNVTRSLNSLDTSASDSENVHFQKKPSFPLKVTFNVCLKSSTVDNRNPLRPRFWNTQIWYNLLHLMAIDCCIVAIDGRKSSSNFSKLVHFCCFGIEEGFNRKDIFPLPL